MTTLLIAIPTVDGREDSLKRLVDSYENTLPPDVLHTIMIVRNEPTWGHGLSKILDGGVADNFDYVQPSCDDLEAQPGWFEAAKEAVDAGFQPAPHLDTFGEIAYGHPPDGNMADWKETRTSVIPFMKGEWWGNFVAPMLKVLYYSDDLISEKLRRAGISTKCRTGYRFKHYHHMTMRGGPGMNQDERMEHDGRIFEHWLRTGEQIS